MLNYLEGSTRPDLSMAVHQTSLFDQTPMLSHENDVKHVCRCLMNAKEKEIICKVNVSKALSVVWMQNFQGVVTFLCRECMLHLSKIGFLIMHADFPIH